MRKFNIGRRLAVAFATLLMATGLLAVPAGAVEDGGWFINTFPGRPALATAPETLTDGISGPAQFNWETSGAETQAFTNAVGGPEFFTQVQAGASTADVIDVFIELSSGGGTLNVVKREQGADTPVGSFEMAAGDDTATISNLSINRVSGLTHGLNFTFVPGSPASEAAPTSAVISFDKPAIALVGGPAIGATFPPGTEFSDQIRVTGSVSPFGVFRAELSPGLSYRPGTTSVSLLGVNQPFSDPEISSLPGGATELRWFPDTDDFEATIAEPARLFFGYEIDGDALPGPASLSGGILLADAQFSSSPRTFNIGADVVPSVTSLEIFSFEDPMTIGTPSTVVIVNRLESGPATALESIVAEIGDGNFGFQYVPGSSRIFDLNGERAIPDPDIFGVSGYENLTWTAPVGGFLVGQFENAILSFDVEPIPTAGPGDLSASSTQVNGDFGGSDQVFFGVVTGLDVTLEDVPAPTETLVAGEVGTATVVVAYDNVINSLPQILVEVSGDLRYIEGSTRFEGLSGIIDPYEEPDDDFDQFRWQGVGPVPLDATTPLRFSFDFEVIAGSELTSGALNIIVTPPVGADQVVSAEFGTSGTPAATGEATLLQAVPLAAANGNPASIGLVGTVLADPNTTGDLLVFHANSCTDGLLDEGAFLVGTQSGVTTDANGELFFAAAIASGLQTGFVSARFGVGSESACVVLGPDNDSWTRAATVNPGSFTTGVIDGAGVSRWYKFPVQPGAQATVALSELGENYDIAVFKDIAQAYDELANPEEDLHRLSAEFAPSVFSPSVFSPSVFSPSVFSPDAYAPSVFSPSVFSPSVFSPSVFSPSVFSPSVFSPSVFSPSVFSPSVFSPSVFSPSVFSPSVFSPSVFSPSVFSPSVFSPSVFSSAQSRSIVAVSANEGTAAESVVANTWNNTGDYYVRVTGRNGAFNAEDPFQINVDLDGTFCLAALDTPQARTPQVNPTVDTVIVWDRSKIEGTEAEKDALLARLNALAARPEVDGVVVDITNDSEVLTLRAQAEATPNCVYATNLVAESIKNIVDSYRNPELQYVTLVGADDSVPFFRYPDQALLGPEQDYEPPVADDSASQASLRLNYILGQDQYGSRITVSQGDGIIPIPDLAVGRLVETAAEATGVIDAYLSTAAGVVGSSSSYTTGYDFLTDSATEVANNLEGGTGGPVNRLIDPADRSPDDPLSWTATDLADGLLTGERDDLIFLAGHFSANSALAADYETSVITTQLRDSTKDFTNSIVFSGGCHSGYNIVDGEVVPGVTLPLDWAQAFAQKQATLIAGTGYQYGDTDFIEYSERLYVGFSEELRADTGGPIAVGQALNAAKQRYLETTPDLRGLHRKSLIIATVFGLPMISVDMPNRIPQSFTPQLVVNPQPVLSGPGGFLDLESADVSLDTTDIDEQRVGLTNLDTGDEIGAWYYTGPQGVVTNPAEPAIPLFQRDVSVDRDGLVLRGVGFRGGSYVQDSRVPLTGAPTTELRGVHAPFGSTVWFPLRITTTNYLGELNGGEGTTTLSVTPVQHRVETLGQFEALRRRYSDVGLRLFYSGNTTEYADGAIPALAAAPTITDVSAVVDGADIAFSAVVLGDPAAGIQEVWVTYTDPTAAAPVWTSLDLVQDAADPTRWSGTLAGGASLGQLQFIVQAANGVGLVGVDDNLGTYFSIGEAIDPGQPEPELALSALSLSAPSSGTFGSTVSATATLSVTGGEPPASAAGQVVVFSLGPVTAVGVTNASGIATASLPLNTNAGSYTLSASFAGTATIEPSSAESPFTIAKAASSLSLSVPATSVPFGTPVDLTATLGKPDGFINERTVFFTIDGPGGQTTVPSITNFSGVASVLGGEYAPGTYTVTARFLGEVPVIGNLEDPSYLPSVVSASFAVDDEVVAEAPTIVYVSSSSNGNVGGITFADEDVLAYDVGADQWELIFDGSRAGITADLNGVEVFSGAEGIERIRMSFQAPTSVPGLGTTDDSDIVDFLPTGFGVDTAGTFERVVDGSDVGLSARPEDIDAITSDAAGTLVLSTIGGHRVPGTAGPDLFGRDEDLLRLDNGQFGANTTGTFSTLFDGSAAGIDGGDVTSASLDTGSGDIYLTGLGGFDATTVFGDGDDVFVYNEDGFVKYLDGGSVGFGGEQIDALHVQLGDAVPVVEPELEYKIYVSSSNSGSVGGINFQGEDVLEWDSVTRQWSMFFDGSDAGLAAEDIDGLDIRSDGSLAISLRTPFGAFDDSDVLLVGPNGLESIVDGSTLGLTTSGEDVSAIARSEDVPLVSTYGTAFVPGGASFRDEDLFGLGDPISMFFDGSDVGLGGEDISAASLGTDELFLSILGTFNVGGLRGDGDDVLRFTGTTGSATSGSFEKLWDGDEHGFNGEQIDALHVLVTPQD